MTFSEKTPEYQGQWCTSACYNDYDCPHEEQFVEEFGVQHLDVKHDKETRHFKAELI